jgi:hypothetical protein
MSESGKEKISPFGPREAESSHHASGSPRTRMNLKHIVQKTNKIRGMSVTLEYFRCSKVFYEQYGFQNFS